MDSKARRLIEANSLPNIKCRRRSSHGLGLAKSFVCAHQRRRLRNPEEPRPAEDFLPRKCCCGYLTAAPRVFLSRLARQNCHFSSTHTQPSGAMTDEFTRDFIIRDLLKSGRPSIVLVFCSEPTFPFGTRRPRWSGTTEQFFTFCCAFQENYTQ